MLRQLNKVGLALAAVAFASTARAQSASLDPSVPVAPSSAVGSAPADAAAPAAPTTRVREVERKGFVFAPSVQDPGAFRFSLGATYDAIDPAIMYGMKFRIPQVVLDGRVGLGNGWSFRAHLNSMYVTTELLVGGSYAYHAGPWSLEAALNVGLYVGKLGTGTFDVLLLSPEYRPDLSIGYDLGKVALSVRGSLVFMGPEALDVGGAHGGLDNSHAFVGHSETVYVENTTQSNGVWYFGVGAMTMRSYYALWLLFPDSPGLFTYPRVLAGYEF
jgi:hypothetical protein